MGSKPMIGIMFVFFLWMCLNTRLVIGAVIKRTGIEIFGNYDDSDFSEAPVIKPEKCEGIPETVLSAVLGPAFNARYMSINDPRDDGIESDSTVSGLTKRKTSKIPSFSVEEEFNSVFSNDPAWNFEFSNIKYEDQVTGTDQENNEHSIEGEITRDLRYVTNTPWQCESKVDWIDLGRDYFPRFLRTVECAKSNCWYGFYICKPRSFTVKLLRRRNGVCIPMPPVNEISMTSKFGVAGLPNELRELWVWEERAVNFCCECAAGP